MKNYFALLALIITGQMLNAQSKAFNDFIIAASSKTNPVTLVDNFKEFGGDDRFFSAEWVDGYVYPKNGDIISNGFKFNYDFDEKTLYLKSSNKEVIAINMISVKKFGLINKSRDTVHFRKVYPVDNSYQNFYEVIGGNEESEIGVFKMRNIEFRKADKNEYLRNFTGDYNGKYISTSKYFIYSKSKGVKQTSSLSRKDLSAIFLEYKDNIPNTMRSKKKFSEQEVKIIFDSILNPLPKSI